MKKDDKSLEKTLVSSLRRIKSLIGVLYKTQYDQGVAVQILQRVIREPMGVTGTTTRPQENKQLTAELPKYAKYVIRLNKEKTTEREAQRTFAFASISSLDLFLLARMAEELASAVENHWDDFPEERRQKLRELLNSSNSCTHNPLSVFKAKVLLLWIKIKCSQESINALTNASAYLRKAITRAVELENSAQAKAIQRLASLDESTEWDTLVEKGEHINIEDVTTRLKKRGYRIRVDLPGEESSES
jgi:hypothetical protein